MSRFVLNDPLKRTGHWLRTEIPRRACWRPMSLTGTSSMIISPSASGMRIRAAKKDDFCWRPKCNNFPKCNNVLNVIAFGPKSNKLTMQSFNSFSALLLWRTSTIRCWSDSCCTEKKTLTSIHVKLRARWYRPASFYLLDISREALAANHFTDEKIGIKWQLAKQ